MPFGFEIVATLLYNGEIVGRRLKIIDVNGEEGFVDISEEKAIEYGIDILKI